MSTAHTIRRLLVANRGEIAIRIISSARELGIHTVAIYTTDDENHAIHADEAVNLKSPSDFMNGKLLTQLCLDHRIDSVHPGYGFLSENADFAESLEAAGVRFVGPTPQALRRTGDKTTARALAESCGVPVLPALREPIARLDDAAQFISATGFPLMIKAVDGGGGRGIRLVSGPADLKDGFERARGESPGGKVFIEKAAIDGYRHVEVQIIGDGQGDVAHLWERECSIQRRFQKMVELAPSTIVNRDLVAAVIQSAIDLAKSIQYRSLGTFEYLVHESRPEFYFLEVNPRLQVEHTVTEEIADVDLVRTQLLIAQGATVASLALPSRLPGATPQQPPKQVAIQLRVTAEDPLQNFTLSMGRVSQFNAPGGRGIRVETHLSGSRTTIVGSSFDSLLTKIIVRASSREEARLKGLRALCDLAIHGVKTNLPALVGTLLSSDFQESKCSTTWLESNISQILKLGQEAEASTRISRESAFASGNEGGGANGGAGGGMASQSTATLFKKGDSFRVKLSELSDDGKKKGPEREHVLVLDRIANNDFPNLITGDVSLISESSSGASIAKKFAASLSISTTGSSLASSHHRKGDASNPNHVILPFPGTVVELLVDPGDQVQENEVLMVVRQMKMELEVRAPTAGVLKWVCDVEAEENVGEGMLVCEIEPVVEGSVGGGQQLAAKL